MSNTRDLTAGPVSSHIRQLAVPVSVGFFFNTMYNVVDTWFAGLLGTQAIAALSLSLPVFFLVIACGTGISSGTTALIANSLGAGKREDAERYASQGIAFGLTASALLAVVGIAAAPFLFRTLGAEESYLETCMLYIRPIFLGSPAFLLVYMANAVCNAAGDTKPHRNFLVTGFVANCILDPWFIYGGLGIPAMGIQGVAVATVLIQVGGAVYLIRKASATGLLSLRPFRRFIPRPAPFADIARQGLPSSINFMTIGLGIFVITYFISLFGKEAVAAYGIATRVEQIALMPTIGLNVAVLSIVAQNNGALRFGRVRETLACAQRMGAWVMGAGTLLVFFLREPLMRLFTQDAAVIGPGSDYLAVAAFVLYAYVILFVNVAGLQGLKRPMFAIWIGLARQIVLPVALFQTLIALFDSGLWGIWGGIAAINWIAAGITVYWTRRELCRVERIALREGPVADRACSDPS